MPEKEQNKIDCVLEVLRFFEITKAEATKHKITTANLIIGLIFVTLMLQSLSEDKMSYSIHWRNQGNV